MSVFFVMRFTQFLAMMFVMGALTTSRILGQDINSDVGTCAMDASQQEPQRLMMRSLHDRPLGSWLEENRLVLSGWTDVSWTPSSAQSNQFPYGFNDKPDQFLLQQNWVRFEQKIDTNSSCFQTGFRTDLILPGSDYRFTTARGLGDGQLRANGGLPNRYGFDPIQFYGESYIPTVGDGLQFKVGRFFAPYGVESNAAIETPLASRSYTFLLNPFTQTGALAVLKLNSYWSAKNGIVMGNDVFIDPAASPYYVGGLRYASDDEEQVVDFTTILGNGRFDPAEQFHNPQIFDLVMIRKLNDHTRWTCEGLYGFTHDVPNIDFANWFGVVNYIQYDFSKQCVANSRLEFFDDSQGQRTGTSGLYTAATIGFSYKPFTGFWLRPETRYDHNRQRPFENEASLWTTTLDAILLW